MTHTTSICELGILLTQSLKGVRNAVFAIPGVQPLITMMWRRGLFPRTIIDRLQPTGRHEVVAPDGTRFTYVSGHGDLLARTLIWHGFERWESTTIPVFYELAHGADVFLDVGAYTGIYTLLACVANPAATVIAFEPNPEARGLLKTNVAANGLEDRVTIRSEAASDAEGVSTLHIPDDDPTASSIIASNGRAVQITTIRGDDAVPESHRVSLVKIDVEGAESAVLAGFEQTIRRNRPDIVIECLGMEAFLLVRRQLADWGYTRFRYFGSDGLVDATGDFRMTVGWPNFLCQT